MTLSCGREVVGLRGSAAPGDGVGDDALDLGLVIDRELLVARAEVKDAAGAAAVAASAAEHLAALEGADEHELVWRRDVEELAVHLVVGDHDRLRNAGGD